MRVALMIEGQEGVTWEQWLALARAAEDANLEGLFRSDHYRSIVRGDPAGSLDAWATLAGLAAATTKLRLGTMVSPVTFRRVSVLAKLVTTVDHISNGRVELGIGAGWYASEHEAYGFKFLSTKERLDELDRQLEELTRQWTDAPDIWPKPDQQPHPPIIVGGNGPKAPDRALAYGDEWMPNHFSDADRVQARIRDFVARGEQMGRGRLGVTVYGGPSRPDAIEAYAAAGVTRYLFRVESLARDAVEQRLDKLAGVIESLRGAR
jgi:alkanesulfonate monooxygenase SsuD/methylene tetrahydromethanopterin reductase-like flavin-dependent oxidoreductase (luciferase family)